MYMALAWYLEHPAADADRSESRHCCSDRDYYRALGVDVDARPKQYRQRRRLAKLRAAIPASLAVFRELMRRPAGGTVVVLVPRAELPLAPDDVTVIDDQELLRDAS